VGNLFLTTVAATGLAGAAETTRWRLAGGAGTASRLCNKNTVAAPAAAVKITDSATAAADGNSVAW
jgi:hypothetical protein